MGRLVSQFLQPAVQEHVEKEADQAEGGKVTERLKPNLSEDRYVDRRPWSQSKLISVSPGLV